MIKNNILKIKNTQALELKRISINETLSADIIHEVFNKSIPAKKVTLRFNRREFEKYFSENTSEEEIMKVLIELLEKRSTHLCKLTCTSKDNFFKAFLFQIISNAFQGVYHKPVYSIHYVL